MKPVTLLIAALTAAGVAGTFASEEEETAQTLELEALPPEEAEGCPAADSYTGPEMAGDHDSMAEMPDDEVHAGLARGTGQVEGVQAAEGCPRDVLH